jgi:uncharacterized repeat protein (TIGR01451 family)
LFYLNHLNTTIMKNLLRYLSALLFLATNYVQAQPDIQWQKTLGGSDMDNGYEIKPTSDGGFITVGESKSNNGNVSGHHANASPGSTYDIDVWVVKTDMFGNIQWQQSFGGTSMDYATDVLQTADGGYIVMCTAYSTDGDVVGSHGGTNDIWILKLDALGNVQWKKCYGGSGFDSGQSIIMTNDGGYMATGFTQSNDGDVSGNHGAADLWLLKLDVNGNIVWQKCLGGTGYEGGATGSGGSFAGFELKLISIIQTTDKGYFIGTSSSSNDGDLTFHNGAVANTNPDYWAVKTDSTGAIQWQKTLGGSVLDIAYSGFQTADGGYIIAGESASNDGDVSGNHSAKEDAWIVKFDAVGNVSWKKILGGTGFDRAISISATSDGGYFLGGETRSPNGGDVAGNHSGFATSGDAWLVKLDVNGMLQWQKCIGGSSRDIATSCFQAADGGYMIAGWASSSNGDVIGHTVGTTGSGAAPYNDVWLVKLYPIQTNVITGNIFEDLNGNCVKDTNEVGLYGAIVEATPGNYFATTDANGNYSLFVDTGVYVISHTPTSLYNQTCVGSTYTATINSVTPNFYNANFGDTLKKHCADLKISIAGPYFRQCFKNYLNVAYSNFGAVDAYNVTVAINFDSYIIPISSTMTWTQGGSVYTFTIDTLKAGHSGSFMVLDSVSCATPVGAHCAYAIATIHGSSLECDITNNTSQDWHYIVGSCDPNAKEVAIANTGYVTKENCTAADTLVYLIRFQNTGTFAASTVVIRDTLPSYLDAASVESGAGSHPYTFRIYGPSILEWTFNNINLPDSNANEVASHGFIKFTIRQKANNTQGTLINNSANIVFDYNNAVLTDTTVLTIPQATTYIENGLKTETTILYPNPANHIINVELSEKNENIEIIDLLGNEVIHLVLPYNKFSIDISSLQPGIYFMKTKQGVKKFIKQ